MKVTIDDFQSIHTAALECTGLTVIVGPSNYGKSAVLRAIEGVLFNRPGEHIVRKGAKNASVTIDELPGDASYVVWTKGAANKYQINGVDYTRVGSGAPQPLQDAGYRDVWIGDADKKKGESIRPQVGEQFEPLFLLTRSSGFVADVLGLMSRHHVVATAQDRCASDLRSAKQRLGVRRGDLEALDAKLDVLDVPPVIGVSEREGLQVAISRAVTTLVQLRAMRESRARLVSVPALPSPPEFDAILTNVASLRPLLERRAGLLAVPAVGEPSVRDVNSVLTPAKIVAGVRQRRLLALVTAPSFKPLPSVITGRLDQVRALVEQRREAMDALFTTQQASRATEDERVAAQAALDAKLAKHKVCPTCGQPMAVAS